MYFDSLPPSHSFHGSNSSHSKDNGLVACWCNEYYKLIEPATCADREVERTIFQTTQQGLSSALQFHRARNPRLKVSASYANERSSVISVSFDEDKRTLKAIITIVTIFLLFAAIPVSLMACKTPKYMAEIPKSVEGSTSTSNLQGWSKEQTNSVRGDNPRQLVSFYEESIL